MSGEDKTMMGQVKRFQSTLEVLVAVIICMLYLNNFVDENVVSKREFIMGTNEIRIAQVEAEIRQFKRDGLDSLSTEDKESYDELVESKKALIDVRNRMLGISE